MNTAAMISPLAQRTCAVGRGRRRASAGGLFAGLLGAAVATNASAATFDCVMNPALTVKVGSPVTSVLSEVVVDRGDVVKKGDPLARIESAVEQASVAVNEARASSTAEIEAKQAILEQKSGEIKRKLELQARNAESQKNVDTAQAEFNVAKADVTMAELAHRMAQLELDRSRALLDQRTIRSPFDGVVVERALGPGEFVRQDANVVTLAKIQPLNVEAYLPVRYYGTIKIGDTANVHPDDPVGGEHAAKVSIVDRVFDAASGTFGVRLTLPNPDNLLPGGLRCRVTFDVAERPPGKVETSNVPGGARSGSLESPAGRGAN